MPCAYNTTCMPQTPKLLSIQLEPFKQLLLPFVFPTQHLFSILMS